VVKFASDHRIKHPNSVVQNGFVWKSESLQPLESALPADKVGEFKMKLDPIKIAKLDWIEPEITSLDVLETEQFRSLGADVGGNPFPDSQRS
jgi:hypothetical protein